MRCYKATYNISRVNVGITEMNVSVRRVLAQVYSSKGGTGRRESLQLY